MFKKHYIKTWEMIERRRFALLLFSTVLLLILPAFAGSGLVYNIVFSVTLSFVFIQSMVAANLSKARKTKMNFMVFGMILITVLEPFGIEWFYLDLIKTVAFTTFFIFVISFLLRFIQKSPSVNQDVLITSINIYLLGGIIGAFLSIFLYNIYPDAYIFPAHIQKPNVVNFLYYSFITMSTVGYGDITPKLPETQTLAYLMSVTGQLYVAIIIAFLVGKLLVNPENKQ